MPHFFRSQTHNDVPAEKMLSLHIMKRLFLLDAYALIYRAYYALIRTPRMTSHGLNTSAIFGFCNTLDDIISKERPSHIAVCFDPSGPTFRHEAYPEYKAQRDKQPEDITASLPYIKRILEAMHITAVEVPGYEADDIIGTLSRMAEASGFETYMMTPDKDYAQLVTEHVFMYRPALRGEGGEIRNPKLVCERYGVPEPARVIDLLALEGDASDNVPGCPGVGEKTARKLIEEWGSVENMLAHTDEIKGAIGKKISANRESILFSKFLVTIKTDVPVDITLDSLKLQKPDTDALREIYRELEFRSFIKKLDSVGGTPGENETPAATPAQPEGTMGSLFDENGDTAIPVNYLTGKYTTVSKTADITDVVIKARDTGTIGLATYATGEEAMTARLRGVALSWRTGEAAYIPLPEDRLSRSQVVETLRPLFEQDKTILVSHDVKRDMLLLRREGVDFKAPYFDTAVAHYLIDSEMKHSLPVVMLRYLSLESSYFPADARKWYPDKPIAPDEARCRYCSEADAVMRLKPLLEHDIAAEEMTPLLHEIELPMVKVLAEMEWTGVRINPAELNDLSTKISRRVDEMEEQVFKLAGRPFNISSPSQVGEVLFGSLKLDPKAKRTTKGAYSTTEAILEKHRDDHPIVALILEIRKLRKLLATYIDALPRLINPETGKIHSTFNQTITATGRLSSTNPNLQNIPIRTDDGREIRRAFIADSGDMFMSADYSQIELRLIACLSADPDMTEAFLNGYDIHSATAARIYHGGDLDAVTEDERRHAKTANFGIIYGISAFGLSERLRIPRIRAKELIDGYFKTYPKIREYLGHAVEIARTQGWVSTVKGRRRRLPDINSRNAVVRSYAERNAVNAPLQGSAADIIKIAMVSIYREIGRRGLKSRMILQVHDELLFNVVPDELEIMKELVTRNMEQAWIGLVPLKVSLGVAANWLEAH